jgi:hypothetical protein
MSVALSVALAVAFLSLSGGAWRFWGPEGPVLLASGTYGVIAGGAIAMSALVVHWFRCKQQQMNFHVPPLSAWGNPWGWGSALVVLFFSHWLCRSYSFIQGPLIRGELLLFFLLTFLSIGALSRSSWRWLPILSALLLIWSFFEASGGKLLFMDDHAMFLFRFKLLREHFPLIPFWSPMWNAGIDARDFFATGALNAFLLAAPLFYLFGVEQSYNTVVALFLFGLVPAASYAAGRLLGAGPKTASIAAVLSMCSSLLWYRWALKYGTMGFLVSTALLPLTVALSIRFITSTAPTIKEMALFIVTTTLTILWSLAGVALIPLALIAIPRLPMITRSKRHMVTIALLILLNAPWMAMMWKVSNVSRFISSESQASTITSTVSTESREEISEQPNNQETGATSPVFRHRASARSIKENVREGLRRWQEEAVSLNPLLVTLALPALIALPGVIRLSYALIIGWLFILGTFAVPLKPQLELDRMLVIGAVLLSVPIAALVASMIEATGRSVAKRIIIASILSFLFTSPFAAATVLFNRSLERFYFANSTVDELTAKIHEYSSGGRTLFTGCVLHQLSNGHLAPVALWSETPLIASSYAHNIWAYKQPIPKSYLSRDDAGIREYLDTMNVTTVIAHEPHWRKHFQDRPTEYAEVARVGRFIIFKRLTGYPSYTLSGSVSNLYHYSNKITFTAESTDILLKFNYFPFLQSSQCSLTPHVISPELTFIKLSGCAVGEQVTIESISPSKRLFLSPAPAERTQVMQPSHSKEG